MGKEDTKCLKTKKEGVQSQWWEHGKTKPGYDWRRDHEETKFFAEKDQRDA